MLYLYHNVKIGLHYLGYYRSVLKNEKKCIKFNPAVIKFVTTGCVFCSLLQSYNRKVESHYK